MDERLGGLGCFDDWLLARLWPCDSVLMGLLVCTQLRDTLLQHKEEVSFNACMGFADSDQQQSLVENCHALSQSVKAFKHGALRVHVQARRCKTVEGLLSCLKDLEDISGRHCLISLDLMKTYLRTEGAGQLAEMLPRFAGESLTNFVLSRNKIKAEGMLAVCEGIQRCTAITHLDVSNNALQDTAASRFANTLSHLPFLRLLDVSTTGLGRGAGPVLMALRNCRELTDLDMAFNELWALRDAEHSLSEGLRACSALTRLNLEGNWIRSEGATAVARGLEGSLGRLQELGLASNGVGVEGVRGLCEAAGLERGLARLGLGGNQLHGEGVRVLCGAVGGWEGLVELDVSCSGLGSSGAALLAEALPYCHALRALNLDGNQVEAAGAGALGEGLPRARALRELRLVSNGIGAEGARRLAGGLGQCRLERVYLGENGVGVEGGRAVCAALEGRAGELREVDLSENELGGEGLGEVGRLVRGSGRLELLELSGNAVGEGGAGQLAEAVGGCGALGELSLNCCALGGGGAALLAGALPRCGALAQVDLAWNAMGDAGATALAAALGQCRALQCADASYNRIELEGCRRLAEAARGCRGLRVLRLSGNCAGEEHAAGLVARCCAVEAASMKPPP